MSIVGPTVPSLGWVPSQTDVRVFNRRGDTILVGEVVMFDFEQSAAEVTTALPGTSASVFANVVGIPVSPQAPTTSTTGFFRGGVFAIAMENITDNQSGMVRLRGICRAKAYRSPGTNSTPLGRGNRLAASPLQKTLEGDPQAGTWAIGISLEQASAAAVDEASAEMVDILFNGVEGFGNT